MMVGNTEQWQWQVMNLLFVLIQMLCSRIQFKACHIYMLIYAVCNEHIALSPWPQAVMLHVLLNLPLM